MRRIPLARRSEADEKSAQLGTSRCNLLPSGSSGAALIART